MGERRPSSISLTKSLTDWWSFPKYLKSGSDSLPDENRSEGIEQAKLRNRLIEYELFKAILSDDIYLHPPNSENGIPEDAQITGEFLDVDIGGGMTIHEFYLENRVKADSPNEVVDIVLIHGYMAALGYFVKNFEEIVKAKPGVRLHVIDLPGFGNSSRPKFPTEFLVKPSTKSEEIEQILNIEDWFINKIEEWRIHRNLRHFKLIGHSMGGYLSSCYLMKYNNQYCDLREDDSKIITEFIIVSPMGTESNYISLINNKLDFHESSDPLKDLVTVQTEDEIVVHDEEFKELWEKLGKPKFPKHILLQKLWEWNKSPFQMLQILGPFYSKLLSYWSFQRFRNLRVNDGENEVNVDLILKLHNYSYSIFNQFQGSGELAITKLINHEILAKLPLCDRGFVKYLHDSEIRTLWLYGDKDWMNFKGGYHIFEQLSKINSLSSFQIIKDAGHHIYLDNPEEFNKSCLEFFNLI